MSGSGALTKMFLQAAMEDPRISPSHICIYIALVTLYNPYLKQSFSISKKMITKMAKISASTFHRSMHELADFGYLQYSPSFDPRISSTIQLLPGNLSFVSPL